MARPLAAGVLISVAALMTACSGAATHDRQQPPASRAATSGSSVVAGSSSPSVDGTSPAPTPNPSDTAAQAHWLLHLGIALPDPKVTPGGRLPHVGRPQICQAQWNRTHKEISFPVQNTVAQKYGVIAGEGTDLKFDQLIPASLGGSATVRNVWPQPKGHAGQPGYRAKNELERHMHQLVCDGQVPLGTAQRAIAGDWVSALHVYTAIHVLTPHPNQHHRGG